MAAARLPSSGVTAGTYGNASTQSQLTLDSYGRVTSVANVAVAIPSGAVAGLAASATTDVTDAANIARGTLAAARLPSSGVTAGTYGSANTIPVANIDALGRVTGVTATPIAIPSSAVTGLAASATTDVTDAANITRGTLAAARLPSSGVTAGTYGNASTQSQLTLDSYGRVTSVANVAVAIPSGAVTGLAASATTDVTDAANITRGTLAAARLPNSGVTAGTYGNASTQSQLTLDSYGRVTSVANVAVAIPSSAVSGLAASATTDTTDAANITKGTLAAARLPSSGVTAGTYGNASTQSQLTLDSYGHVTSVANVAVAIPSSAVTGLAASATTDVTDAANITRGTLAAARLPSSGVTAGTYGNASTQSQLTLDSYGRVTSVANVAVAIPSSAVTGLAASATTDVTDAANITRGTLAAARLPSSGVTAGTYGNASTQSQLTLDSYGRVTSVANVAVAIPSGAVAGLAASATTDVTDAANIARGTLAAARLPSSGVTAGTYGSANTIPVANIDALGRVTGVTATPIAIPSSAVTGLAASATTDVTDAANITRGTLAAARLPSSGVTAGTYGNASTQSQLTLDSYGRVTSVANVAVAIPSGAVTGLAASATTDVTDAANITRGTLAAARLPSSGVTAGTYGSANNIPVANIDALGRVTGVTATPIAIPSGAVSGLAASATTDVTDAANITKGTLAAARLPSSGVTAGTYGSANTIPVTNIDTLGRVTGVTATPIAIPSGAVSGLAASATTDATDAANITKGTLPAARLPTSGVTAGTYGNSATQSVLSIDSYGRVTGVANVTVSIPPSAVSGRAASATTDVTDAANITRGTLAAARLPTSGVTAGIYGNATTQSQLTLDSYGRVTSVANVAVAIPSGAVTGLAASATTDVTDAANITRGTLAAARLPTSGVTAGTYGNASTQSQLTLDSYGRVTSVANVAVAILASAVSGLAASATTDATDAANITKGTLPAARLPTSGVTAGTYGNSTTQSVLSIDSYGRVTGVANVSVSIPSSAVTGLAASATTDVIDAANITKGTLAVARLPTSGVTAGTYGSANIIPVANIDALGRVTGVTATPIAISSSAVSGLAASATTDTTDAANITRGTLAAARLPSSGVTAGTYGNASTQSQLTLDSYGRVTSVANVAVAIPSSTVTGLAASATTDVTDAANITRGTLAAARLPSSGVTAGTYGNASTQSQLTLDSYGRVTSVANVAVAIPSGAVAGLAASATTDVTDAANIARGTLAAARLPSSGVTAGTYGSANTIPVANIDALGRVTGVTATPIAIPSSAVTGLAASATTDVTDAANITRGTLAAARLPSSGVTAGTYGNASTQSQLTLDSYGRVTSVANVAVAIPSGAVAGLAASATTDVTDAANITRGTLAAARLPSSGVTAGTYGSANTIPVANIDALGRVTGVTATPIAIPSGAVSGLAASATTDVTYAANITKGTLAAARLPSSGVTAGTYGSANTIPVTNIDTLGRVTGVTATPIAIPSGAVSGLAASATTDVTDAANIARGTLAAARLPSSGVTAGTCGSANTIPVANIDALGRVTGVTATPIAIPSGAVAGLAASATTDVTDAANITKGTLAAARLPTSGVTAGTYGNASTHSQLTLDSYGRVTAVANVSVSIPSSVVTGLAASATTDVTDAANITEGTLAAARLPSSGVTAGTYGSANTIPVASIDALGRVTGVTATPIAIPSGAVSGLAASATTDVTDAANITRGTLAAARLPTSGVTAGTYGNASTQSQLTLDSYGRVTSVANVAVAIPASAVSGLAASATTDATDAANITKGTLPAARLPTSGVTAGTYGNSATQSVLSIDSYGRVTGVANVTVSIPPSAVSGLAASATTDVKDAANITRGTLAAARLPTSGVTAGIYGNATTQSQLTLDSYGRVTSVANVAVAIPSGAVTGLAASATTDVTDAANITRGTLAAARLPTSGVTANTYGNASTQSQLTLDSYGPVTSVANVAVAILASAVTGLAASATTDATDAANITKGTLPAARLPTSGVTAGTYGNSTTQSVLSIDSYGRVTGVANVSVSIPSSAVTGLAASATTDVTDAANITKGTLAVARLPTSGVTAGTYGSANIIPVANTDALGRVTGVTATPIAISSSVVSGLAASATTDVTDAANITKGTLAAARLPTSGVTAGTYGNSTTQSVLSIDSYGRVTGVANVSVSIPSSAVTGLAASATTDATDAANITKGTLAVARLPNSGVTAGMYGSANTIPVANIDASGRVTGVTATPIAISSSAVSGLAASATTDVIDAANITKGTLAVARLPNSGVTTGTYGNASTHSQLTLDSYGRVTSVANVSVSIPSSAVTGLAASATTDATDAANITRGTLAAARLPTSGVTAGTYGNASTQSQLTLDSYGRVTSVANVAVAIPSCAVSGLAASATTDATDAANISKGVLGAARGGTGLGTLTAGKILVGNGAGAIVQDTNFHWDSTNDRLGLGTAAPTQTLEVVAPM